MRKLSLLFVLFLGLMACSSRDSYIEVNDNFNEGWKFMKAELKNAEAIDFDDSNWEAVTLPHDWAIKGPFSSEYNARTGGLPVHGMGWYRKAFHLDPSYKGKRISVEFDGAQNDAHIWVNGKKVGNRPYGYISFNFDITDFVHFDKENVIAVRLNPKDLGARWYPGAGIYRNVRLKVKSPVHIPMYGTYLTTPKVDESQSLVHVETTVKNDKAEAVSAVLETVVLNAEGEQVASKSDEISIEANAEFVATQDIELKNVTLWDIENPYLYNAVSSVKIKNTLTDTYETPFGIRTINFSREKGFELNGKQVELNGVCMHHDLGPLGAAVNYRATERQLQIMKSMGVNALRTSHNPPSPEQLQVCDRLGIVVQVEAFDEWKIGKVPNGYNQWFDEWHERDLRDMIKRDRNHPSVIMWSIGNEILEQGRKDGWKVAKMLNDICHDEDPTRPTTAGFNYFPAPFKNKLAEHIDIVGMNYWPSQYQNILNDNPDMLVYGSETSSQTSSRGVYHLPIADKQKHETNQVSSYDVIVGPPWAYAPDVEFDFQEKVPQSLGEFIWTGFDYLGEPTPYGGRDNSTNGYWNDDWPSHSSYFAPVDLCGFPKDRYYLYQSQWTKKPMVHVLPHWNWAGMEGKKIPVYSYTNCEEVELFVNGKSMGKKVKGVDTTPIPSEFHDFKKGTFHSKYRLSWEVPYKAGEIKVIAYNKGKAVAEKVIKTAEKASAVVAKADRTTLRADGTDLAFVEINIADAKGVFCPSADNKITFKVEGEGELVAVGNGNSASLESFVADHITTFSGKCLAVIKTTKTAGTIKLTASSEGLESAVVELESK